MFYVWGWLFAYKSPRMSEVLLDFYLFIEAVSQLNPEFTVCVFWL